MNMKSITAILWFVGLGGFAFHAHEAEDKRMSELAASNHLTAEQTAAFKSCHYDVAGKSFSWHGDSGGVSYSAVPDGICLCQARTMAEVFKFNKYGEHSLVVESRVQQKGVRRASAQSVMLDAANLKPEAGVPELQFDRLKASLSACMAQERMQEENNSARLKLKYGTH